jgi:beta-N-acetylhexosaminidase
MNQILSWSQATELAAQLVMIDMSGPRVDEDTQALLARYPVRALCLFRRNLLNESATQTLCGELRERLGPMALLAIDQEGGPVSRATFVPVAPPAMALGALDSEVLARETGAAVARSLRHLGLNWNFAPLLDINNNPANPVISERSFGDTAERVTRLARAWMHGSLSEGLATCVKHFPGHGDTHTDSHHALPEVNKSMAELEALELQPFRALAPEAPAMMTAHIVYPQLDADLPATLSRLWLTGVLRERLAFQGVIITDALMMDAVKLRWGHAQAAVLALQAGADMVLAQGSLEEQLAALDAIRDALLDGRLPLAQARQSAQRLDALAQRYPLQARPYRPGERERDDAFLSETWARSLTVLRGAKPPEGPLRVIAQGSVAGTGVSEAGLSLEGVKSLFAAERDIVWHWVPDLQALQVEELPLDGRLNVLVSTPRKRLPKQAACWPVHLQLLLWNPFQALDCHAPALISWGYHPAALVAVREWLAGRGHTGGVPPVRALAEQ